MLQSPRKKILQNTLQVPAQMSHPHQLQQQHINSSKSLSDAITNLSSQDSLQQLKKEEFKSLQKMRYLHESEQNQMNNKIFLNDQKLQQQKKKLMQIKITNNGNSIDGDTSTTLQFVSKIIDEEQLQKKQSLQKNYQTNMYAKIDSYAFKTFLNVQKSGDLSLRSSPLIGAQTGTSLTVPLSSNNLQSKPNILLPTSSQEINEIYSSNFQPSLSFYNQTSKPQTPRKKKSFQASSFSNSSYGTSSILPNNQKSLKIIDDQRILQGSIQQVSSGFLTSRRNHSTTLLDQLPQPPAKNIVSHNQFIRGQLGKRQDALQVKNYLEMKMKELLSKDPLTKDDIFVLRQNIYSSCLEELIRQISLDCKERAFVLQEIWDSTMELMTHLFIFLEKQKSQMEKDLSKNIQELHQKYQKTINEDLKIINKQQSQIADRDSFIEKQIQENRYLRKKDRKLEKLYKMSQNSINYLQDELNSSIREHLKYLMSHEDCTWREALEYQRKYFELTKNKRIPVQKSIKEISQQIKMHVDQNEIQQHIDMDEILKEYIIDPVENQLQNIIQEVDNESDQTDLKIGFHLDDQDYIKNSQTQTDFSIFNLVEKETNTEKVLVTELDNKKNRVTDSSVQCKVISLPIYTQTEIHELCSCAQQTEYTGNIMDIKVGEEYWDKDLNNSFFEQFNKKCVAVQTVKEVHIRIPSETEIELDSLKGTHISLELKNIIETAIQKEHISTEGLYECKKLIEQKIKIQEKLVRNVKDKFIRHQQTELEMNRQKTDLENQLQIVKDQNQLQISKLLHLSEDYKKLQNIMMIKVEELSFESMDSDLVIDQTSRTQLMNTTLQQQPFDSEETKQIIDNQDQSKQLNRKVSMISAYSGSQNSQRQITAVSELDMRNYKSTRSVSEIKQIPQQQDQFKKRYSNHQSLSQQNKEVYSSQSGTNQSQMRKNSQQRGQQDTSINVSNMKRTSFSSSVQPYQQQSNHLNSITSMPDTSQDRYRENGAEDDSQCSSEFRIPSLKDLDKDENEAKKRQKKNTTKQETIVNNSQNPTKSLNIIPFSQLTRNNIKTTSIHTEAANNLLIEISRQFIKSKPDLKKNKFLPQINKTLSMVYSDLIKLVKNNNALNPLHVVTYEQFIHRFGLKKVAEQKMIQEIQQAMLMANENNRCKVFIKMLYAQEGANITSEDKIEEVKFFVNCLLLLDDSKQAQNYNVDKSFTSSVRVHESFPKIFADILNERQIFENMTKLIKYPPETLKDIQNNDHRRLPTPSYEQLDIDLHLDLLLQIYSNRFEKN